MGRVPEAMAQFEEALRIDPNYVSAHDNLGQALEDSKRVPEAIGQYQAALQLDPNDLKARQNLARLQGSQARAPGK
jgi:tetratricopeptide (TPR) repeat protein